MANVDKWTPVALVSRHLSDAAGTHRQRADYQSVSPTILENHVLAATRSPPTIVGLPTGSRSTIWCARGELNPHALAGTGT